MSSGVKVQLKVIGAAELKAKLAHIQKYALPSLVDRNSLGAFLVRRMRERFRRGIDPDGNPWKPLSPRTRRGKGILRKTENLYNSIVLMEGNDRGGYALATGYGFRIGIKSRKYMERNAKGRYSRQVDTAVYGRVHQLGNSHVKQRRFIGLSASDRAEVSKQLRLRLAQVVNEAKVKV